MNCKCGHAESEHSALGCMHEFPNMAFCACMNKPESFISVSYQARATIAERERDEARAELERVKAERDAALVKIKVLFNVAHDAVGHVAAANYPERESLAHKWIDDCYERKP